MNDTPTIYNGIIKLYNIIINFIFYKETNRTVQKNVLTLTQISFFYCIYTVYNVLSKPDLPFPIYDVVIAIILFLTWYGVKKHSVYYSHLLFIVLVPIFNLAIVRSVSSIGIVGTLWVFPIISTLYFFFYKRTALVAVSITFVVTVCACLPVVETENVIRVAVTMLLVILSFSSVFFNFYLQYEKLEDKAQKDSLTQLFNRSVLEEYLITSMLKQETNLNPIILCFDLDDFKYVNDTFGHSVGDTVLVNTAQLFKSQVRQTDKVFRLGGEEFLILLNNISLEDGKIRAEKIRQLLEEADLTGNGHTVTSSIGLAVYQPNEGWDTWLKRADDVMYDAKQTGKNKVISAD